MRTLYYNRDERYWATTATNKTVLKTIRAKRTETLHLTITPVATGGTAAPWGESATGLLVIKPKSAYTDPPLFADPDWDATTTPGSYTFTVPIFAPALDTLLGTADEKPCALEILVTDGPLRHPLPSLDLIIENNYARDNDPPLPAPTDTVRISPTGALQLRNPDTDTWHTLTITGDPGNETLTIA